MNAKFAVAHGFSWIALVLSCSAPVSAQTAAAAANADIAVRHQQFLDLLQAADRTCLSNTTEIQTSTLRGFMARTLRQLSLNVGYVQQSEAMRGAARDLPPKYQGIENDHIRACMNQYTAKILGFASSAVSAADESVSWPEPIDLRLNLIHSPNFDSRNYADTVQLNVQSTTGYLIADRLAVQDPHGLAYYNARMRYPKPGETMRGTLVAETRDGYRTTKRPQVTALCFERPATMPTIRAVRYEEFDCQDGKSCKASKLSARWLRLCPIETAQIDTISRWHRTLSDSLPSDTLVNRDIKDDRVKWVVPSIGALAASERTGVGYTIFTIESDVFHNSDVRAVEVNLDVNGTVVLEDGLEPSERPVANDPKDRFSLSFALQTLDFAGADHGCDHIGVSLRPIGPEGGKGAPVRTMLDYVALRDVLARKAPLANGNMTWSAGYVVPAREWRAIAELRSYIYPSSDLSAQSKAAEQAMADSRQLDSLQLAYQNLPIVGVVRPPRTIQANGTAAYGLAAGLVQPNGQIRFTFSPSEEGKLADYLFQTASERRDVAAVIRAKPFLFQANSASQSLPGVCGREL